MFGVAMLVAIASFGWEKYDFERHSVRVMGRVVDFSRKANGAKYWLVVDYEDATGRAHRLSPNNPFGHEPTRGAEIAVLYRDEHPDEARLEDPRGTWLIWAALSALALAPTLAPLFVRKR